MVYTTFYPTTYMVSRIAGAGAKVVCPVPADADPSLWQPTRGDLAAYQSADVIVINGASFEKWVATASLPDSRVIDCTRSLAHSLITFETVTHSHGTAGPHTHSGTDGHTWLDPINAKAEATEIADSLARRWPDSARQLQRNLGALLADLDGLDRRLQELAPAMEHVALLASHPAYNYLSRRYGWQVMSIPMEPDSLPDDGALKAITEGLAGKPDAAARILLWEQEPPADTARFLGERYGIKCVRYSPCEMLSPGDQAAGRDFLAIMNANIDRLAAAAGEGRR